MSSSYLYQALSVMYKLGAAAHRNIYDMNVLQKTALAVPVIGVGNLSFGGSGKTLLVQFIAEHLAKQGSKVGIVCRSYTAQGGRHGDLPLHDGPQILSNGSEDPYVFGDEAAILHRHFSTSDEKRVCVASGRDKSAAARMLAERVPDIGAIVVDDAFQHHRLRQDVRILIWPKPSSLTREFKSAARHADLLLVPNGIRSPRADADTVYFVKEMMGMRCTDTNGNRSVDGGILGSAGILPAHGRARRARSQQGNSTLDRPVTTNDVFDWENILVVGGLGPETDFFHQVRKWVMDRRQHQGGAESGIRELRLPDHADYRSPAIQARLFRECETAEAIVTTEKDAVKLERLALRLPPIYVVRSGIKLLTNEELFWRTIESSVKKG